MPFPAFLKKKKAADKIAGKVVGKKCPKCGGKGCAKCMKEESAEMPTPSAKFGKAKDQLASLGG